MISLPPKIDLLPEHLIDQIKAGEVIERPGNLIKEILENSVDAGSTRLELQLKNNGLDLISLKDNGHGMRFSDLPLAFSRHATSKISRFEDLYRLSSFGFRGEALASISAISRLQCITYSASESKGAELRIEGGETVYHGERQKNAGEQGTELVIQDLFFNTPARLKFIQSQQAEKTFIRKIIFSFILSHPEIEFHLKWDESEKEIYPIALDVKARLQDLMPKAAARILQTQRFYENTELTVYLIPGEFKAPIKIQNIYINERFVLDKQLHRVMSNALMANMGGDDWHYLAFFDLPADSIDVNVHPNKTIIKCMDSSKMISLLTSTIKELASTSVKTHVPQLASSPLAPASDLFDYAQDPAAFTPSLSSERQAYNMEGFFSPHRLPLEQNDVTWIGPYFIREEENRFWAVSAPRLLHSFVQRKLLNSADSIPLLVSEPFLAHFIQKEKVHELNQKGFELEYLGKDTIVLRSIPEWMNGFPLQAIMNRVLQNSSLHDLTINQEDWSQSTWDEMLAQFSLAERLNEKIVLDLLELLSQRFK